MDVCHGVLAICESLDKIATVQTDWLFRSLKLTTKLLHAHWSAPAGRCGILLNVSWWLWKAVNFELNWDQVHTDVQQTPTQKTKVRGMHYLNFVPKRIIIRTMTMMKRIKMTSIFLFFFWYCSACKESENNVKYRISHAFN